ncbi:MAG TPA: response regulator transcription factor [Actinomycetota bacterium]|nr:response regulator transcription factor [Actinomycetota bacterium]
MPEEAIELCREHQPDVVLMDIVFKGHMDGIKATRRIKEVSPATKVVIMTAHDDDRLLVEAVEAGPRGSWARRRPPARSSRRQRRRPRGRC